MNKEDFILLFVNKEAEIVEHCYTVSNGKTKICSYLKRIKYIDDEHFTTSGYGYNIKYDEIQKWRMQGWSSNCYSYTIFLLKNESIDNYLNEINNVILEGLNKEISKLQKSIDAINCISVS
jgi:hypothetical protein